MGLNWQPCDEGEEPALRGLGVKGSTSASQLVPPEGQHWAFDC